MQQISYSNNSFKSLSIHGYNSLSNCIFSSNTLVRINPYTTLSVFLSMYRLELALELYVLQ